MTMWQQLSDEAPGLAEAVRARLAAETHHVLATLRADGSPRLSGTEVQFHGPELTIGSMLGAMKARDLQRDTRCALHAHPADASMSGGDAKLAGRAVEIVDEGERAAYVASHGEPPGDFHLFRLDLHEAVHTAVDGDQLRILLWRPGEGVHEFRR